MEKCIMPQDERWKTERFEGSHRHEVFGAYNRQKSIEDGLVIFLRPEDHNMSNKGIHFDKEFDLYAKRIAQKTWMDYYHKDRLDFLERYGRNYL